MESEFVMIQEADKNKSIIDKVEQLCLFVAGTALLALMFITSLDTILRYFFRAPLVGVLELSEEYFMVAIIYMPLSYVYVHGGHIKVELIERFFPKKIKEKLALFNTLVGIAMFAFIAYCSIPPVLEAFQNSEHSASALAYPMAPAYLMVTIGSVLVCVRGVQTLFGWIKLDH